jgi:hypothetical protein
VQDEAESVRLLSLVARHGSVRSNRQLFFNPEKIFSKLARLRFVHTSTTPHCTVTSTGYWLPETDSTPSLIFVSRYLTVKLEVYHQANDGETPRGGKKCLRLFAFFFANFEYTIYCFKNSGLLREGEVIV